MFREILPQEHRVSKEETLFNMYKEVEKDILVSIFGTCQGGACN